jgi:hypothetical protein
MLHMLFKAEVEGGFRIGSGDDVPARPACADMIKRRKTPGYEIGLFKGG